LYVGGAKKGAIVFATCRAGMRQLGSWSRGNFFEEHLPAVRGDLFLYFLSDRMKSVVPGNNHERDAGRVEPSRRSGHGRAGPGPWFNRIKKVARVDECVGLLPDNNIYR